MELRVRIRYKSTFDFGKGDHLRFDKSLAHALEWLYDEDKFEDERTWLYCMEGVLPIYVMMSIVTDIFMFALDEYGETNVNDYIHRMEEGNDKHGWNENKPTLLCLGDEIALRGVHSFTSEVILWAAYLYTCFRAEINEDDVKIKRAKDVLYKLYWKKTCLMEEFVKDTFLMKHFEQTKRNLALDVLTRYKDDKPEKPTAISGKKEGKPQSSKKTKDTTTATFTYSGFSEDNYSKHRLNLIVGALVGKFVAGNVNKNLIKDLFTGVEIGGKAKIIWKGTKGELVYFFRKLNEKNYISWPDGEFMWAIVASHFKIVTEYKNGKKREVSISADSLQFYTDTPKDDIKRQLDKIINMFEPDLTKLLGISPIDREEEAEKARHEELAREDFARQNKR